MDKRDKWIAWNKNLIINRNLNYDYYPEESKTDWWWAVPEESRTDWWTGWVSENEYGITNKHINRITKREENDND